MHRVAGISLAAVTLALCTCQAAGEYVYDPSDFAIQVIEYVPGTGIPRDSLTAELFDDPSAALGRPTIDTTGDGWDVPLTDPVPVVGAYPAHRSFELVSLGGNGRLTVKFDHAVADDADNPYGIDLVLFGNAFCDTFGAPWANGDPNGMMLTGNGMFEPGTVSVSQDGQTWYAFTAGPFADDFAPTLGRVYGPQNPDTSIGSWNQWWSEPTDPTYPLDPQLGWIDFEFATVAEAAQVYGRSAGGTGFDLAWLGSGRPDWIQYVRIESAGGVTPEIDAIADVAEAAEPGIVPGDANRDLQVNLIDLGALATYWMATGPDVVWAWGDFNFDNQIDLVDLGAMATNWGYDGSGGPVPEPTTGLLLVWGFVAICRRRR